MLEEIWLYVICLSKVICEKCEDAHLNSHGEQFYGSHEMFANIQDAFHGFADDAMEVFYGCRDIDFPSSNQIIKKVSEMLPEESSDVKVLAAQIKDLMLNMGAFLGKINNNGDTTIAEQDVVASFSKTLQQKLYFLNRFLK